MIINSHQLLVLIVFIIWGGLLTTKKIFEATDSEYNLRTRVYQLNKQIIITLYSTNIIKQMPSGQHLNYTLASNLPEPLEPMSIMFQTNRRDLFTVTINENGIFNISYVYSFAAPNYTQIAQQITYFTK